MVVPFCTVGLFDWAARLRATLLFILNHKSEDRSIIPVDNDSNLKNPNKNLPKFILPFLLFKSCHLFYESKINIQI
jgi:hypothetical protein